jgi:hypothetical protein
MGNEIGMNNPKAEKLFQKFLRKVDRNGNGDQVVRLLDKKEMNQDDLQLLVVENYFYNPGNIQAETMLLALKDLYFPDGIPEWQAETQDKIRLIHSPAGKEMQAAGVNVEYVLESLIGKAFSENDIADQFWSGFKQAAVQGENPFLKANKILHSVVFDSVYLQLEDAAQALIRAREIACKPDAFPVVEIETTFIQATSISSGKSNQNRSGLLESFGQDYGADSLDLCLSSDQDRQKLANKIDDTANHSLPDFTDSKNTKLVWARTVKILNISGDKTVQLIRKLYLGNSDQKNLAT